MGRGEGSRTVVVIVDGDIEMVVARVDGIRPDLALADALARLQLAVRRLGGSIRLRDPSEELRELLDLVGLAHLMADGPGSALEAHRETEGGEQLGVEEVVPPGDLPD